MATSFITVLVTTDCGFKQWQSDLYAYKISTYLINPQIFIILKKACNMHITCRSKLCVMWGYYRIWTNHLPLNTGSFIHKTKAYKTGFLII